MWDIQLVKRNYHPTQLRSYNEILGAVDARHTIISSGRELLVEVAQAQGPQVKIVLTNSTRNPDTWSELIWELVVMPFQDDS